MEVIINTELVKISRDHLGLHGKKKLIWIFKKYDTRVWIGLM
jgi:hypothetical protein